VKVDGSRALITGASSGIGAALARAMVAGGATVGIVARRADKLAAVLADCQAVQPACRSWVADLGDVERAEAIALEAWDLFGGLDVLVNNAAVPKRRPAARLTARCSSRMLRYCTGISHPAKSTSFAPCAA